MAVLFVGLSFEGVDSSISKAPKTPQPGRTPGRIPGDSTRPAPGGRSITLPAGAGLGAAAAADDSSPMGEASDGPAAGYDAGPKESGHGKGSAAAAEKAGGPAVLSLELLQGSFSLLQSIVASHGGVIKELSVDDKGTVRTSRTRNVTLIGLKNLLLANVIVFVFRRLELHRVLRHSSARLCILLLHTQYLFYRRTACLICNSPCVRSRPRTPSMLLHEKVLVAGFGLSPQVGHLPAARATLCAMECTDRLRARGLARCHAGVATGPVFCGSLGSEDR